MTSNNRQNQLRANYSNTASENYSLVEALFRAQAFNEICPFFGFISLVAFIAIAAVGFVKSETIIIRAIIQAALVLLAAVNSREYLRGALCYLCLYRPTPNILALSNEERLEHYHSACFNGFAAVVSNVTNIFCLAFMFFRVYNSGHVSTPAPAILLMISLFATAFQAGVIVGAVCDVYHCSKRWEKGYEEGVITVCFADYARMPIDCD